MLRKSTLLNILGLLDRPDGGTYLLDGTDYSDASDEVRSAARNRKIGFVFQQFHLLDRAPAVRNVTLPLLYAENGGSDGIARAERALDAVGLSHRRVTAHWTIATQVPTRLSTSLNFIHSIKLGDSNRSVRRKPPRFLRWVRF